VIGIGATNQFAYDGRGNRLLATRAGVTTRYIYDPWGNLMAEADSNGITRKYIYGKGLLAVATSEGQYCYHFNGTGSTVAITDMNQAIANSYAYDPFGQILGEQETITQPFKYVGQYGVMAEPNGLYYMRARYYDPAVGRFISEDPLGFGGGDVNLFAYVQNDPVNRIDPLGLQAEIAVGTGVAGMGIGTAGAAAGAALGAALPIILYPSDIADEPPVSIPPFPITKPDNPPCESSDKKREKNCDDIYYNIDIPTCRGISRSRGKAAGASCYAAATERYSACLSGRPMPPLNTWNN
jgi:RHS repeat-associated protein